MQNMNLIATTLIICISSLYFGINSVSGAPNTYNVYNFGATGNAETDDSKAFLKAWNATCEDDGDKGLPTLVVPRGTFLVTPLIFEGPCKSGHVNIKIVGNVVAPNSLSAWGPCPDDSSWIVFSDIDGLIINGNGLIDGRGSVWWKRDEKALNNQCPKPTSVRFHRCNNLDMSGVNFLNSPKNHISINDCNNVTFSEIHITAPPKSRNTDGIDISGSNNIKIEDSTIATGDDCIAINGGCSTINITNVNCGPEHGISVGSLGKKGRHETVEDVYVKGCTFTGTKNGARIKTWPGGSGYARRITFENITLINTKNPIIIDQYYCNGDPCPPKSKPSAVQISDVTFNHFVGSSVSKEAIKLNCSEIVDCTNIVLDHVQITSSGSRDDLTSECANVNGTSDSTVPAVPCLSKK